MNENIDIEWERERGRTREKEIVRTYVCNIGLDFVILETVYTNIVCNRWVEYIVWYNRMNSNTLKYKHPFTY